MKSLAKIVCWLIGHKKMDIKYRLDINGNPMPKHWYYECPRCKKQL